MSTELWVSADELSKPNVPEAHQAVMAASYLMWALSGRRFGGEKRVTERYECPCRCTRMYYAPLRGVVYPVWHNGGIYNVSNCYSCGQLHRLRLRGRPVREVEAVSVDGVLLPETAYEIHDDVYLMPTGVGATWGLCNTVDVTYTYGAAIPEAGRRAARLLAEQLLLANVAPDECTLPDRVTSISRQGVSFTVLDPQTFLDSGRLGIYEVDAFLRTVNPTKSQRPARVLTPDMPRGVRVRPPRPARTVAGPYDIVVRRGVETEVIFQPEQLLADLTGITYTMTGQINAWNGASVSMDDYLTVTSPPGGVGIVIPAEDTTIALLREGTYDVYARTDENTVIHILSGRIITS